MIFTQACAVTVPVRNFDKCVEFYTEALGVPVATILEDKSCALLRTSLDMDLWLLDEKAFGQKLRAGNDAGPVFVCPDLEKVVNGLGTKGIKPLGGLIVWPDGSRHVNYRDPDGNLFTLYEKGKGEA
jgi:catechol 2,3-dioxygenase-like lactoylglutathione lyase family enzyme